MLTSNSSFRISAGIGFFAVALGAFGAHGLKDFLAQHGMAEVWGKAVLYHLAHSVALLCVAMRSPFARVAWRLMAAGVLVFSGSLYLLALTQARWLGAVTPAGGLCLLAGWLALVLKR
jgi:uncharacterized membrane protein YgdD (TMEM256/DUF423 family)